MKPPVRTRMSVPTATRLHLLGLEAPKTPQEVAYRVFSNKALMPVSSSGGGAEAPAMVSERPANRRLLQHRMRRLG